MANIEKAKFYFEKALEAYEKKDYKIAKNNLEKAIAQNPKFSEAYVNLGFVFESDYYNDLLSARECYEKALNLNDKHYSAILNLGNLLADYFEEYDKAKEYYKKAIGLSPEKTDAYNSFALLLLRHYHDYYNAEHYLKQALEINPNCHLTNFNLGAFHDFVTHNKEYAKELYKKAITLNSTFLEGYNSLALILMDYFNDYNSARKYLEKANEIDNSNYGYKNNLGSLLFRHFKEYKNAKELFEEALKLNPEALGVYYNLSKLYYEGFHDSENAQKFLMKIIELEPNLDNIRKELGKIAKLENPTFISEFEIKNVRHLKSLEISLSNKNKKHLFLTGKNGSGKTSVLKAAEDYLQNILTIPVDEIFSEKGKKEFWLESDDYPLKFSVTESLLDLRIKYETGQYAIVFFSDERKLEKKLEPVKSIDKIDFKLKTLPKEDLSKNLVKFLVWQDYKLKSNVDNEQIKRFFEKIDNVLKLIYDDENLSFKINLSGLEFNDELNFNITLSNGNNFKLSEMAAGYSAIFEIIFELVLRMEIKPEQENSEGIVLIDEPETHLHIDMQKKIMPILTQLFPNIQFIIATHSPFVLNSLSNAVIFDLETKIHTEDFSSIPADKLNEYYFRFTPDYVRSIEQKVYQFEKLVGKMKNKTISEDETEKLAELEIELDELTPYISKEHFNRFKENQQYIYER